MEKIEFANDGTDGDGERRSRGERRGIPLDRVPEVVDNRIAVEDGEAADELAARLADTERDIVDAPRSRSFEFASRFSEESYRRR